MLSPTNSVISAGMVMSFSLITFMQSCSPSALSTCSSFARPIRTAILPRSSLPERFCSSRIFQRESSSRYPMSIMIVPIRRAMPEHPSLSLDPVRGDQTVSPLGIPCEPDCVTSKSGELRVASYIPDHGLRVMLHSVLDAPHNFLPPGLHSPPPLVLHSPLATTRAGNHFASASSAGSSSKIPFLAFSIRALRSWGLLDLCMTSVSSTRPCFQRLKRLSSSRIMPCLRPVWIDESMRYVLFS